MFKNQKNLPDTIKNSFMTFWSFICSEKVQNSKFLTNKMVTFSPRTFEVIFPLLQAMSLPTFVGITKIHLEKTAKL